MRPVTSPARSTVLVVDDHDGFRGAARTILEEMGLEVVAEADSGEQAIEAFGRTRPDIVLLDVQLPGLDGIEVARALLAGEHPPMVVLTSSRDREDYGARLRGLPQALYIGKTDLSRAALAAAFETRS